MTKLEIVVKALTGSANFPQQTSECHVDVDFDCLTFKTGMA